jgi:hypothetical protein
VERQQLELFVYTASFILFGYVLVASPVPGPWSALIDVATIALPVAVGIAVLRYRLYDIDVLVERTLVYGALSLILAAMYFASVLFLQGVLHALVPGSELAVALSTLAVVALFAPLRWRIQRFVDRRFYRSRYDAARTLDDFSVRLRDVLVLDAVRADLLSSVRETLHPAHASVWLRQAPVKGDGRRNDSRTPAE